MTNPRMSSQPVITTTLLSAADLFPLGEPGGVSCPIPHTPGPLRPYVATLAVPMPEAGKHSTTSTRPATSIPTQRSDDGKVYPDTTKDVGSDS